MGGLMRAVKRAYPHKLTGLARVRRRVRWLIEDGVHVVIGLVCLAACFGAVMLIAHLATPTDPATARYKAYYSDSQEDGALTCTPAGPSGGLDCEP